MLILYETRLLMEKIIYNSFIKNTLGPNSQIGKEAALIKAMQVAITSNFSPSIDTIVADSIKRTIKATSCNASQNKGRLGWKVGISEDNSCKFYDPETHRIEDYLEHYEHTIFVS